MKFNFYALVILLVVSCTKEQSETHSLEPRSVPPFVLNENCDNNYYVRLEFPDGTIQFLKTDPDVAYGTMYSSIFNMIGRGVSFKNTVKEEINLIFFIQETQSNFVISTGDYNYGYPLRQEQGAYIQWLEPISDTENPEAHNEFYSTNTNSSYFYVTFINDEQMCGEFRTTMKDCCREKVAFELTGDFSIPTIKF